ncbi:MAG: hypothetical protein ABWY79_06565 [Solirubrobacterales bacterium]
MTVAGRSGAGLKFRRRSADSATSIDHLCIGENAITAIDVERAPGGDGRAALIGRLMRETEILAAVLGPVGGGR